MLKFLLTFLLLTNIASTEIIHYELMDETLFKQIVVGNTVVGKTLNSHSLYHLYFNEDGSCQLWKQNKVYEGFWWIENNFVRAFWPEYTSSEEKSIFNPNNPKYGKATALNYYYSKDNLYLVGNKNFKASILILPGKSFP